MAEGLIFSHGSLVKEVGISNEFEYFSESHVIEALLTYRYWKAGYTLYALNDNIVFHDND